MPVCGEAVADAGSFGQARLHGPLSIGATFSAPMLCKMFSVTISTFHRNRRHLQALKV